MEILHYFTDDNWHSPELTDVFKSASNHANGEAVDSCDDRGIDIQQEDPEGTVQVEAAKQRERT